MDKQAIYNQVRDHLLKQNAKSQFETENGCFYRGPNGMKCAIGALIKDEFYKEEFNRYSVTAPPVLEMLKNSLNLSIGEEFSNQDINFMRELQHVHDCYPVKEWQHQLQIVANVHGLTP